MAAGEVVWDGQAPVTVLAAHPVAWPSCGAACSARYTDTLLTPRTFVTPRSCTGLRCPTC